MKNNFEYIYPEKNLEEILHQVPVDYYQKGVKSNMLQRIWHISKLKQVVNMINFRNKKPKKILDVGCASGWFLSEIAKHFPDTKCSGIDLYKEAIEYGKKKYPKLELVYSDAHKLPYKNNSFDAVICCEVLEHVFAPDKVIKEIKRVLKPEGFAVIEIDSGNFLFKIVWYFWTNLRKGVWRNTHIHPFNAHRLEQLFERNGFCIKKKKIFNLTMAAVFLLEKSKKSS